MWTERRRVQVTAAGFFASRRAPTAPQPAIALVASLEKLDAVRVMLDPGHGAGTNVFKRAEEDAQTPAFLFRELDVAYSELDVASKEG